MIPPTPLPAIWMIDACSALNLLASGHFEAVLRAPVRGQPVSYAIADVAVREATALRRGGSGDDANEREPIDLGSVLATGVIRQDTTATTAELAAFVSLATQIDDGEAMTLALASTRTYGVVTDDRKAQRFLGGVPCLAPLTYYTTGV